MELTDEDYYGCSDHKYTRTTSFTIKGRRTKRQRTVALSYGAGEGGAGCVENSYGSSASATPSNHTDDHQDATSEVTTEEEDMANCLILLAQGIQKKPSSRKSKTSNNNITITNNNNVTASSSTSVIGVYECKTCYKTFHSFQALGGHRTSHKKVKPIPSTTTTTAIATIPSPKVDDHYGHDSRHDHDLVVDDHDGVSHDSSPLPSQVIIDNNNNNNNNNNKKKGNIRRVHECTICGSEFPSGQALGGHMRRHRAAAPTAVAETATAVVDSGGARNVLTLDLNLPAPNDNEEVDAGDQDTHMVETKFHVLPTPALVDCHY